METQQAEIASLPEGAEVDSGATTGETEGSAPSAAETGAAKDQAAKPQNPDKQRDSVNERFDKLTRDLYELRSERDRDRYEIQSRDTRIQELERQLSETAKQRQVAPDSTPTLEQFGYDEAKFTAALAAHFERVAEQKGEAAAHRALEKHLAQQRTQQTLTSWSKREAEFVKSQPDYVDKVANARSLPISKELQAEIQQMENGPQLAYYLVENREKAQLIMQLPFQAQLRELGRIEGLLEAQKAQPKPPMSQAPPPPSKLEATEAPVSAKVDSPESDSLSDAEWMRRRNAQQLARQRNRRG